MAEPELTCEVRTTGGIYRNWLSVLVEQDFLNKGHERRFALTCAEPDAGVMKLAPGDRVDIALAGHVVIEKGFIEDRQAAYDANRHAVQVIGSCAAGPIAEVSITGGTGQYRGYTVEAIANSVLKPFGRTFKVQNGAKGWDTPFPNVVVHHGESPISLIQRLCRQRNLFFWSEANGDLVAGPKADSDLVDFVEGQNILSANCSLRYMAFSTLISDAQQPGSDSLFGKRAAQVRAQAELPNGPKGQSRIVLPEMSLDQRGTQLRTDWEASRLQALATQVQVTYRGWLKPGLGGLWEPSDGCTVKSPMLFPIKGNKVTLKLAGYAYQQSEGGGTTTTVSLIDAGAYGQRYTNAKEPDFGSLNPGSAQPVPPQ